MVDVAEEAFRSRNFSLASEIYERVIREQGPASSLLVDLGSCLALEGRFGEAFTAFLKAYRLSNAIKLSDLTYLVQSLIKLTRDRMLAANNRNTTGKGRSDLLLVDTKEILECEPFFCGICLHTVSEPVTIYCGHTFCQKCLEKRDPDTCISCGKNPSISTGHKHNVVLTAIISKLFPKHESLARLKSEAKMKIANNEYDEAIGVYSRIIDASENDHMVWGNRSYAYLLSGNFEQAFQDASTAVRIRPQWAKGYYRKASAEESLGRAEEAAISYMKCLAIDSQATQARTQLTQIVHSLLKPKLVAEDLKHVPSTSAEPVSNLMEAGNYTGDGLTKFKALLDKQFQECDTALHFESEIEKVDPSVLSVDMFECNLCFRLLHHPVTTPCGHVFCQHCLNRSMDHSTSCPQCRGSLAEHLAHRNRAVTLAIQRMLTVWFPKQMEERKLLHEQDIAGFSLAGNTAEIPIFVCMVALPTIACPLHIYEPRYKLMMRQVMESGVRQFGMCLPLRNNNEDGDFVDYGTMLEINDLKFFDDGRSIVDTIGGRRFRVMSKSMRDGYDIAKVQFLEDEEVQGESLAEVQMLHDSLYSKVKDWVSSLPVRISDRMKQQFGEMPERESTIQGLRVGPKWVWWVTAILPIEPRTRLLILQMSSLKRRLITIDRALTYVQNWQ